jgi:hypothetical protein
LVAVAFVVAVGVWGTALNARGENLATNAPPFHGTWRWLDTPGRFVPFLVGAAAVVVWPWIVRRASWRVVVVLAGVVCALWAAVLAASGGWDRIWGPLTSRYDYLRLARSLGDAGDVHRFLQSFVDRLPSYPTHVRGHPPLPVVWLWLLDALGLDDRAVGLVVLAVGASAAPASLLACASLAGRDVARRAAYFVPLLPAALWMTSLDGVFMALAAWSAAGLARACCGPVRGRRWVAGAAGLVTGLLALSTYGVVVLSGPVIAIGLMSVSRRRLGWLTPYLVGVAVPLAAFAALGFWWPAGFAATRVEYWAGVASSRPYGYYLVANVAVLAAMVGPAALGGLSSLRRGPGAVLVVGALVGAAVATLSGYSKGEVERIWLPLAPFVLVASGSIPRSERAVRPWLVAQVALAAALQFTLGSPW